MSTILIDLDNTLYDLDTPWHDRYNKDYPHHTVNVETFTSWERHTFTAPECGACIYKYLDIPEVYLEGKPLSNSIEITQKWKEHELIILGAYTSIKALEPKALWVKENFPHIKNTIFVNGHIKHHVHADILIDDGEHNHSKFNGISILYDQPWNRSNTTLPRARNWDEVNALVLAANLLLKNNYTHKDVQSKISSMFKI